MADNLTCVLSDKDREAVLAKAAARTESSRRRNAHNLKVARQSQEFVEAQGAAGELAFLRLMGMVDNRPDIRRDHDGILPSGLKYDIKTTDKEYGRLLVHPDGDNGADVYVLMIGTLKNGFRCAGWAWKHEILDPARQLWHDPKISPGTYALDQCKLHRGLPA